MQWPTPLPVIQLLIHERQRYPVLSDIRSFAHLKNHILCACHWPTGAFLNELKRIGYGGFCSVGVYHTKLEPRECIARSMDTLRLARRGEA